MKDRFELAAIGAVAGYCLWGLFETLPHVIGDGFLLLALTVAASVFFSVLMALVGPERPLRAVLPSLALGVLAGALAFLAALRFDSVDGFYDAAHPLMALFVLVLIGAPFAAAALEEKQGWRHYARLFDSAWGIFIRYVAGWLFAGLIFLVLLLSDELLKLVGITLIGDLLEVDWLRYALLGAVFGLGVATVHELRDYVSPVLVHRLLRMLLPLVLLVVIVFIGALPFRGLSDLFGKLSTAGVLMAVAFAGITLITTAIDRDDESAAQVKLMTFAAQAMALLVPVLVGLAIYAIWLRVAAYGWTPSRVIAAYIALFLVGYVVSYLWAVLRRAGWQARLRQSNLYMALAVGAGAALWLTPLMTAEGIATGSQVARYEAGRAAPEALPLYEMAHDWGVAGRAGLERLEAAGDAPLVARIAEAREATSRWRFAREEAGPSDAELRLALGARVVAWPAGSDLAPLLDAMNRSVLQRIERQCPEAEPQACAIVLLGQGADPLFGKDALFVTRERVMSLERQNGGSVYLRAARAYDAEGAERVPSEAMLARILAGAFELKPMVRSYLQVGDQVIIPYN